MKIGIDLIENKRIKKSISDAFVEQILTNNEKLIYMEKKGKKQIEFLCGRFAAKEAIIKALGSYENPHMLELEILNNKNGEPIVSFKNYNILVSISHEEKYTIAQAVLIE